MPQIKEVPDRAAHKPMHSIPYFDLDGYLAGDTDAQFLSIGLAQWDNNDVAIKIFRYVGDKWSRQSEELPLHRAIDMVLFLSLLMLGISEIPKGTFADQSDSMAINNHVPQVPYGKIQSLQEFFDRNPERLDLVKGRLSALRQALNSLFEKGIIPDTGDNLNF